MIRTMRLRDTRAAYCGSFRSTSDPHFRALNPVGMVPPCGSLLRAVAGTHRLRAMRLRRGTVGKLRRRMLTVST
jgi:hypothetical protein